MERDRQTALNVVKHILGIFFDTFSAPMFLQ
jgi:hypothetical protein